MQGSFSKEFFISNCGFNQIMKLKSGPTEGLSGKAYMSEKNIVIHEKPGNKNKQRSHSKSSETGLLRCPVKKVLKISQIPKENTCV